MVNKRCSIQASRSPARGSAADEAEAPAHRNAPTDESACRPWLVAVSHHESHLVAYLRCVSHEPAEIADLLHDTIALAWCERGSSPDYQPDESELLRHARRASARWMAAHRREVVFDETIQDATVPANDLAAALDEDPLYEDFLQTLAWIRELPQQQHYALVFRLLRGARFDQVAMAIGCSVSAAKTHYRRGVDALRRRRIRERREVERL